MTGPAFVQDDPTRPFRLVDRFVDRAEAGRRLAARLEHLRGRSGVVVGLPRGGVPVAAEVARALGAPLDVIMVRKLGVPFQPELAMGAIGEGGVTILNPEIVRMAGVSDRQLAAVAARERELLAQRLRRYRSDRPRVPLRHRLAIVVDDGIATGSTARAACRVARAEGASGVVLAVPVAPPGWEARIGGDADECVSVATPEPFFAIGQFYRDFSPTSDDEVVACLAGAAGAPGSAGEHAVPEARPPAPGPAGTVDPPGDEAPAAAEASAARDLEVEVLAGPVTLPGHLTVPASARGIVVFAHGSGSSRHSPRNRYVAGVLNDAGLATLLFDLLTREEEVLRSKVFDVELLAGRLALATDWVRHEPGLTDLPLGYFGASTGAAAALRAAGRMAGRGPGIGTVVSRGGRPDLAGPDLARVRAPTLLVVGGADTVVLGLNEDARAQLRCEARVAVVPGATHLFEEPGTLQEAAALARDWFVGHFAATAQRQPPAA